MKKKWKKLSPTVRFVIVLAVIALVAIGYYYGIYIPTGEQLEKVSVELSETEQKIINEQAKESRMREMNAALADEKFTAQYIPDYNNKIYVDKFISDFSSTVSLVNNQKIDTRNVVPLDSKKTKYARIIPGLKFKVDSFAEAVQALKTIYGCEYMTEISNVTITGNAFSDDKCEVNVTFAFFERAKEETGNATTTTQEDAAKEETKGE